MIAPSGAARNARDRRGIPSFLECVQKAREGFLPLAQDHEVDARVRKGPGRHAGGMSASQEDPGRGRGPPRVFNACLGFKRVCGEEGRDADHVRSEVADLLCKGFEGWTKVMKAPEELEGGGILGVAAEDSSGDAAYICIGLSMLCVWI